MLNKLFNLLGYHVVIVSKSTAEHIHKAAHYWTTEIKFESEREQDAFTQVSNLFNTKGK